MIILNSFCPTGKGGGVDPSCSPSNGGGGGAKKILRAEVRGNVVQVHVNPSKEDLETWLKHLPKDEMGGVKSGSSPLGFIHRGDVYVWDQAEEHYIDHAAVFASLGLKGDSPPPADRFQITLVNPNTGAWGGKHAVPSISAYTIVTKPEGLLSWAKSRGILVGNTGAISASRKSRSSPYLRAQRLKPILNRRRSKGGPPSRRVPKATSTVNPLRIDPTRTITLRRRLGEEFKRRFAKLKLALYDLIVGEDALGLKEESHDPFVGNAFCPTGKGGGVDPSCSPGNVRPVDRKDLSSEEVKALQEWFVNPKGIAPHTKIGAAPTERSEAFLSALAKMPTYKGTAYRGLSMPHARLEEIIAKGTWYEDAATSYSKDDEVSHFFAEQNAYHEDKPGLAGVVIQLQSKSAKDLTHSTSIEKEVVVHGTKMKIDRVEKVTGKTYGDPITILHMSEVSPTANTRWKFSDDPDKVRAFKQWLKTQVETQLLGQSDKELWQRYVEQGFAKGAGRSFDDVKAKNPERMAETLDFTGGRREQFLRDAFGQPVAIEKVKLLAQRMYDDLDGVTRQMSTVMARTLTDGLVQGKSPRAIAKDLSDNVDKIGRDRALVIARTEIIRAHAEGQLLALKQLGVEEVGVQVEWTTTGDSKVCPQCKPMEGVVLTLDEAAGLIPRHPNCRCAWVPAGVGEKTKGQKRTPKQVKKAAEKSGISIELDIGGRKEAVGNTFCPTGQGGGVDPTCSPGGFKRGDEVMYKGAKHYVEKVYPVEEGKITSGAVQISRGNTIQFASPKDLTKIEWKPVESELKQQSEPTKHPRGKSQQFHYRGDVVEVVENPNEDQLVTWMKNIRKGSGASKYSADSPEAQDMEGNYLRGMVVGDKTYVWEGIGDSGPIDHDTVASKLLKIGKPEWSDSFTVGLDKDNKASILSYTGKEDAPNVVRWASKMGLAVNAFCPTGPGGGQDNSCSSKSVAKHLQPREAQGNLGDLYKKLKVEHPELTVGGFHDLVHEMYDKGQIGLKPYTRALTEIGKERAAMFVGGEIMWYAHAPEEKKAAEAPKAKTPPRVGGEQLRRQLDEEWERSINNQYVWVPLVNTYCATGEGGGKDPSCSPTGVRKLQIKGVGLAEVYVNPTKKGLVNLLKSIPETYGIVADPIGFVHKGNLYVWEEEDADSGERLSHLHIAKGLGIPYKEIPENDRFTIKLQDGQPLISSYGEKSGMLKKWGEDRDITVNSIEATYGQA